MYWASKPESNPFKGRECFRNCLESCSGDCSRDYSNFNSFDMAERQAKCYGFFAAIPRFLGGMAEKWSFLARLSFFPNKLADVLG